MKIDAVYREAFAKLTPGDSLLEHTREKMESARQSRFSKRCVMLKLAAACCALVLIISAVPYFSHLNESGKVSASLAVAAASAAGRTGAAAPSSVGQNLTGAASPSSASGSSSSEKSRLAYSGSSGGLSNSNVCIPTYMVYSDGLYLGAGTVEKSLLGARNGKIWTGQTCYEVGNIPAEQSIAVDYNGVYVRFNFAVSSLVRFQGVTYRMDVGRSSAGSQLAGGKIGFCGKLTLYRFEGNPNKVWVDFGPLFGTQAKEKEYLVSAQKIS